MSVVNRSSQVNLPNISKSTFTCIFHLLGHFPAMDANNQAIAGPSHLPKRPVAPLQPKPTRKPRSAHPDHPRHPKITRPPPLPPAPAHPSRPGGTTTTHPHLPIKVLQGAAARRTDSTKRGFGKEVIFVTRKTGLGALMGRCRSLVVDEGLVPASTVQTGRCI